MYIQLCWLVWVFPESFAVLLVIRISHNLRTYILYAVFCLFLYFKKWLFPYLVKDLRKINEHATMDRKESSLSRCLLPLTRIPEFRVTMCLVWMSVVWFIVCGTMIHGLWSQTIHAVLKCSARIWRWVFWFRRIWTIFAQMFVFCCCRIL
jgi:hypothetical protein